MTPPTVPVDTAKITGRRTLRYHSVEEATSDIDRIVEADRKGTLRQLGNWTPGQIMGHIAVWIEYGYDGYPMKPPNWIMRILIRLMAKRFMKTGLPAGFRLPNTPEGTYGTAVMSTEDGARRLKAALLRLKNEPATVDSPALGKMRHEDRIQFNLRHAELHLSYLQI